MAIRPILLYPDETLTTPCLPINKFDENLNELVNDLFETMYDSPGVGLAAPQIGVNKQVSVIDCGRNKKVKSSLGKLILINPQIIETKGEQTPREGCLSIPEYLANVKRFQSISISTFTPMGDQIFLTANDFEALAIQHEIDHLHGKLFLDRVVNLKTDIFRRKYPQNK